MGTKKLTTWKQKINNMETRCVRLVITILSVISYSVIFAFWFLEKRYIDIVILTGISLLFFTDGYTKALWKNRK